MSSSTSWMPKFVKYQENLGKLKTWIQLSEAENWQENHHEQQKNREAESRYVRQKLWGAEEGEESEENEDMRQTVLGDITHPTPIVVGNNNNWIGPLILGAALGMIPIAGIGGAAATYLLTRPESKSPEFTDESVNMGVMKIEDLLPKDD